METGGQESNKTPSVPCVTGKSVSVALKNVVDGFDASKESPNES